MTEESPDADAILRDLKAERVLYGEILAMSRQQREAVDRKDYDAVAALLERKQSSLLRVDGLETRLAPVKQDWPAIRGRMDAAVRSAVQAEVEAIGRTLSELMAVEEDLRIAIGRVQDQVGAELRRLMQARRTTAAYGAPGAPKRDPRFFDKKE